MLFFTLHTFIAPAVEILPILHCLVQKLTFLWGSQQQQLPLPLHFLQHVFQRAVVAWVVGFTAFHGLLTLDSLFAEARSPFLPAVSVPLPGVHTTVHARWRWRSGCSESELEVRMAEGRTSYIMCRASCKNKEAGCLQQV